MSHYTLNGVRVCRSQFSVLIYAFAVDPTNHSDVMLWAFGELRQRCKTRVQTKIRNPIPGIL